MAMQVLLAEGQQVAGRAGQLYVSCKGDTILDVYFSGSLYRPAPSLDSLVEAAFCNIVVRSSPASDVVRL